jgi:tetratricopeptide (TPR) repeat protein
VGRYKEGIPHLQKAAEINAYTSAPYETLAVAHAEKGDDAGAIEILLGAPTSAPMLTTIAQILSNGGEHPYVEKEVLDLALELAPDYYLTHGLLARLFARLDQIDDAVKAAEQTLKLRPNNADAALVLADLKYRTGALEESRHYLLTAQQSRPLDTTLRRVLDQLEAELANPGEPDATIADLDKIKCLGSTEGN